MASIAQIGAAEGLPSSIHTEIAILGAMPLDPHQRIYRCILALMEQGHGVDLTTVRAELERRRELDAVGGSGYIAYLTEGIPRNFSIESYVKIVKDKSLLRQLMSIFHDGVTR